MVKYRFLNSTTMLQVSCQMCSSSFLIKPNRLRRGWGKYCSRTCRDKSLVRGKFFPCTTCQKPIWRMPKEIQKSIGKRFFCNKACHAGFKNNLWSFGDEHFNWRGGKSVYRQLMLRASKQPVCHDCSTANQHVLVVHHLDENRKNNHLDNLRWLCRNCHYLNHKGKTF